MALRSDLQSGGFSPALVSPMDALFCLSPLLWVLRCLTFELTGARRQDALARLAKMYSDRQPGQGGLP